MRSCGWAVALAVAMFCSAPVQAQGPPCPFDAGNLPVDTLPLGSLHGDAMPIDHIVVLMQENRSYDHYFGRLYRRSGPPKGSSNPDPTGGAPIKPFHQTRYCEVSDLPHSWNATHRQIDGGAMDHFTTEAVDPANDVTGSRAMGYYTRRDLPFYYKLYKTFATSDRFFAAVPGPTYPNRYYLLAGTSFGWINNTFPDFSTAEYSQRTIFNLLDEAAVSWKIYYSDLPFAAIFGYVRQQRPANLVAINTFFADAAAGTLPQVTFVDPIFLNDEIGTDEHPPKNIQLGQQFTANVVNAVMTSPQWSRTALVILYDEHGGFYDHVPPPAACVPDGVPPMLTGSSEPGNFDMLGPRVPMVVVSPYAKRKYLSHVDRDHTAVLRFIETRFDLPALTRRDANADPLLDMFDFSQATFATPPRLPAAIVDPNRPECP